MRPPVIVRWLFRINLVFETNGVTTSSRNRNPEKNLFGIYS